MIELATDGDGLRCEMEIAASPERVFEALTTPEQLMAWWADDTLYRVEAWRFDRVVGGEWRFEGIDSRGRRFSAHGEIIELTYPTRLRYSWIPDWEELPATEVRFELVRQAGGTRLRFSHTGFRVNGSGLEAHYHGWQWVLAGLAAYLRPPAHEGTQASSTSTVESARMRTRAGLETTSVDSRSSSTSGPASFVPGASE